MKQIAITLTEEMYTRLREEKEKTGLTYSSLVKAIISRYWGWGA